jgi:cytochrome c biogenesis protein CcdA
LLFFLGKKHGKKSGKKPGKRFGKISERKRKAQFFILTAFAIVSILYLVSRWVEPYTIIDTSSVALHDEPFVFNDLKEKAAATIQSSKACDDLLYNLDEFKLFSEKFATGKGYRFVFGYATTYTTTPCAGPTTVSVSMSLQSSDMNITSAFAKDWP